MMGIALVPIQLQWQGFFEDTNAFKIFQLNVFKLENFES